MKVLIRWMLALDDRHHQRRTNQLFVDRKTLSNELLHEYIPQLNTDDEQDALSDLPLLLKGIHFQSCIDS